MNTNRLPFLTLLLLILFSGTRCGSGEKKLTGFDHERWIADKKGCSGVRRSMAGVLTAQKEQLLGQDEMEVVRELGRPDQHELYKRNQKFFYYNIDPARGCPGLTDSAAGRRLVIRFNAVGLAKEVLIE